MGADHPWLTSHPGFFEKDSTGKPAVAFDWADVRQLDYNNREMQDSMIASMKYWITNSDIDGFRCDVAWNVPGEFWKRCIDELKQTKKSLFFLAEGEKTYLVQNGFDAFYPWEAFHMMVKIAKGQRPALLSTVSKINMILAIFQSHWLCISPAIMMKIAGIRPTMERCRCAIMHHLQCSTQTMKQSVPLIYSGQEEPVLDSVSFFYKDTIMFSKFKGPIFIKHF